MMQDTKQEHDILLTPHRNCSFFDKQQVAHDKAEIQTDDLSCSKISTAIIDYIIDLLVFKSFDMFVCSYLDILVCFLNICR